MVCVRDSCISPCIIAQKLETGPESWCHLSTRSSKDSGSFCLDFFPPPTMLFCLLTGSVTPCQASCLMEDDESRTSAVFFQRNNVKVVYITTAHISLMRTWIVDHTSGKLGNVPMNWVTRYLDNSEAVGVLILPICSWKCVAEHPPHNEPSTNTPVKWESMLLVSWAYMSMNASSATYVVCDLRKMIFALRFNFQIF